jgi:hypothetical protein
MTTISNIRSWTDREVVDAMQATNRLARARKRFYYNMAKIEQAGAQKTKPDIFKLRKMEFEAALDIAMELGVEV